jgi:beta-glucosidase-like glycosyl hydrolase
MQATATPSLKELLGVRFMPRLNVDQFVDEEQYRTITRELVTECHVLGFCLFGGTAERVIATIRELQLISNDSLSRPQLFSSDSEWGLPMRLREGGTEFPDAMAIARSGDCGMAEEIGEAIGEEMRALGICWNFAPVCDVNSNPKNPIINTRSFSSDPVIAGEFASATIRGLRKARVASTAKHFPGHGDTSVDSHRELPQIHLTYEGFRNRELKSFIRAIEEGVDSVMLGHIAVPSLANHFGASETEKWNPATLSRAIVQNLLRDTLHFKGVIVTDAMEMHAITKHYGDREAALLAIKAGVDVVLMPVDTKAALELALSNVDGLSTKELQLSYDRIMDLTGRFVATSFDWRDEYPVHEALARRAAKLGIELNGDTNVFRDGPVIIVADDREATQERASELQSLLRKNGFDLYPTILTPSGVVEARLPHTFSIATLHRARGYLGGADSVVTMPVALRTLSKRIQDEGRRLDGFLMIGSPYLDDELEESNPRTIVKTYSESRYSISEAVNVIASVSMT